MLYESTPEITHPRPNVEHSNEALGLRRPDGPPPSSEAVTYSTAERGLPSAEDTSWPQGEYRELGEVGRAVLEAEDQRMHAVALAKWAQLLQQNLLSFEECCKRSLGEVASASA